MLDLANWTMTLAPAITAEAPPGPGTPGGPGPSGVTSTPLGGPPASQQSGGGSGGPSWMFPVVMLLVLGGMWFMMSRSQKKERKRKQELLNTIKKGDKIETIGGVIGTVVEARDTDVVIESAGTRLRFRRSAVANVVGDKESDSGAKA